MRTIIQERKTCSSGKSEPSDDCNISTRGGDFGYAGYVRVHRNAHKLKLVILQKAPSDSGLAVSVQFHAAARFLSLQLNFKHTSDSFKHIFSCFAQRLGTLHVCQLDMVRNAIRSRIFWDLLSIGNNQAPLSQSMESRLTATCSF
jgi:hypothetical protein